MSNLIISAFADEYSEFLEEQARGMAQLNIGHIELRGIDSKNISFLSANDVKEAKRTLNSFGICVSAIGSPIGKIKLDGDIKAHMDMARRIFEYANIMGTEYVRIFSFYAPDGKNIVDLRDEVFAVLSRIVLIAKEYGVTLCHENEAKIYGNVPSRCREIIDCFDGDIKCVFDMGNFVLEGIDPYPNAYETLKNDIAYFHIKDALFDGAIVPAGKGNAKIKQILSAQREYSKDDFFVSIEPHLQTFSGLNDLAGRAFENPYQYTDNKSAFEDAVIKFRELIV